MALKKFHTPNLPLQKFVYFCLNMTSNKTTIVKPIHEIARILFFSFFIIHSQIVHATSECCDSLLLVLDEEIKQKPKHEAAKRNRIALLHRQLNNAVSDKARFDYCRRLFNEYHTFSMDTSILIARESRTIARRLNNDSIKWLAAMMEAEAQKGIGNYRDALAIMDSIPKAASIIHRNYYYNRYCSLYMSLYENTYPREDAEPYLHKLKAYRDTLSELYPKGSWGNILNRAEALKLIGDYDGAIDIYNAYEINKTDEPIDSAVYFYAIGETYRLIGDKNNAIKYLALSAILDLRNCIKKYMSLQALAFLINEHGDSERAYTYITCSMSDIQFCNARSRIFKITEFMPVINDAFMKKSAIGERNKMLIIIIISLLSTFLIVMLVIVRKKNVRLSSEHEQLNRKNSELIDMQKQQDELNHRLSELNLRLKESNHVKEEYIAYLFNLCSEYIDDMDKQRVSLNRKLKAGQVQEAAKELNRTKSSEYLKVFLEKFDTIFLDLFPNFIESFNALLQPEARIYPQGELLTPELRIYALVRLGINDSTKIASLLHYSPQTVYNYRLKTRNKAIVPKKEFAARVAKL